jgi:hypothetical protein
MVLGECKIPKWGPKIRVSWTQTCELDRVTMEGLRLSHDRNAFHSVVVFKSIMETSDFYLSSTDTCVLEVDEISSP